MEERFILIYNKVFHWVKSYYNKISQIRKKSVTSQSLARLQENMAKINKNLIYEYFL